MLHLVGSFDAEELKGLDELPFCEFGETEQERVLLFVRFREDVVLVVEVVEGLRELERVFGDESRFLCRPA